MFRKNDSTLILRLPREEKKILKQQAQESRLTLSAYVRSEVLKDYVEEQ